MIDEDTGEASKQRNLTKAKKRWRIAYFSVQFLNRMLSFKRVPDQIAHNPDHGHTEGFSRVDLKDLVRCKDLEILNNLSGVHGLAEAFETSLERGINGQDVERRKAVYGSNSYKNPRFFHIIKEASARWSEKKKIVVIRQGKRELISRFDVVVGDVLVLSVGDKIPADGLFIDGNSFYVSEWSMSENFNTIGVDATCNPFLLTGSRVIYGNAQMLVTSVGINTWESPNQDPDDQTTPLRSRLNKLKSSAGKVGLAVAFLKLVVMFIRYYTGYTKDEQDILNSVTRDVVAIPQGLLIGFSIIFYYSVKRMLADNVKVRKLSACEDLASATVICSDITGTLTTNHMNVEQFRLGFELFDIKQYIDGSPSNVINEQVLELYHQTLGLNTTGSIFKSAITNNQEENYCTPTEKAMMFWGVTNLGMDMEKLLQDYTILHTEKKLGRVSVMKKVEDDQTVHVHWKGAAEIVLTMCSDYYQKNGVIKSINHEKKTQFEKMIQGMEARKLRCIAFAHKQIPATDLTTYETLPQHGLTLLGIVGIKDPIRPGAKASIDACRSAGVETKMITGDNVLRAKAIATECGILKPSPYLRQGEVIEGEEFRNLTEDERMEKVDRIRVMARSSPSHKLLMVQSLRKLGHVVAVTGDGTHDAPALKEADIGFSLGIQGTEVAKESSDIVVLDDDFATIFKIVRWGRRVYNNIQKFIQFQLTMNAAALFINFISTVFTGNAPLTAVQMLWANLIIGSLGALALATDDPPTKELMDNPPVGRVAPLITNAMWRNLLAQSLYQITVLLTIQFTGRSIFNTHERTNHAMIFNSFVLCQVFNEFNSRKLEKKNVFQGLHKNWLFLMVIGVTITLQAVIMEFLNNFVNSEALNREQWGICIAIAGLSWPVAWVVKLIPVPEAPFLSFMCYFE